MVRFLENNAAGSYSVVAESLSDVRVIGNQTVIVTQIKRRLTSQSVGAALDELWDIYRLAEDFAELRPRLRFQLQAAESDTKVVEAQVGKWLARRVIENISTQEVEDFIAAVSINKIVDPARELHALLHERLRAPDPVGLARTWLARLIEASENEHGFASVARDIWNDLVGLDNNKRRSGDIQLWRDEFSPPPQTEPGAYLTGQRPMIYHLRDGYFAPRPAVLDRVRREFWEWQESRPAFVDNTVKLPVFWLAGRSGVGKSVLLLQLLADLHDRGIVRVIWLGSNSGLLGRAIEWVQRAEECDPDSDLLSVIAIDDPYQVSSVEASAHWHDALARVDDLRQRGEGESLPLIVCCGPTEQALNLSNDFVDALIVRQSLVANEAAEDYDQLREWFVRRTGLELSRAHSPNMLLVQLFFEKHHGSSLKEFAARFRARIRSMDSDGQVFEVVARVMALNRLYVGYPARAFEAVLTPRQRDAMAALQADEHLENRGAGSRQDTWISHPQIANLMYDVWFPPGVETNVRRGHLLSAIADCDAYGEGPAGAAAPLWALSRALVDRTGDLSSRIAEDNVGDLLYTIFQKRVRDRGLPLGDLPVWLEIAANLPSIEWTPHPATQAVNCLRDADVTLPGIRLTCHKLLQHWASLTGVADGIVDLLGRSLAWHEFRPLVIDASKKLRDPRLGAVIEHWLSVTRSGKLMIGDVLAGAVGKVGGSSRLLDRSAALLQNAPLTTSWCEVAILLLERDTARYLRSVLAWLEGNRAHREIVVLLERLLKYAPHDPELAKWASEWLASDSSDRSHVVRLLASRYGRADVGVSWLLRNSEEHQQWPNIWQATWEAQGRADDLTEIGLAWLESCPEHAMWTKAWRVLWDARCDARRLAAVGQNWLLRGFGSHALPSVWEPLWEAGSDRGALAPIGLCWLQDSPTEYRWPHVWEALREGDVELSRIREMALVWLEGNTLGRHGWHFVWSQCLGQPQMVERLLVVAQDQLHAYVRSQDNSIMARWSRVWRDSWERSFTGRERLSALAGEWLSCAKVNKNWCAVAETVLRHGASSKLGHIIAARLAELSPDTVLWAQVWLLAKQSGAEGIDLSRSGYGWLSRNQFKSQWLRMWKTLWDEGYELDGLWGMAINLLRNRPDHKRWHHVWAWLWGSTADHTELKEIADHWLMYPNARDYSGRDVIEQLLSCTDTAVSH
ncbi:hypothetical protein [Catellatospora vulcania]|uniref:hypothetical protein n=1 Tax=Catellatospora vulcania TaxID=1460450 RepID=UPI0012D39209|nr:hypothetical protein [Catellatospora vulcania]